MNDCAKSIRGFSLVELAVTITVLGLLLAFSVPAFNAFSASHQLKGATENMAAEMRLVRERSIAVGTWQSIHFNTFVPGTDWHMHDGARTIGGGKLPPGITWWSAGVNPTFYPNGRTTSSGMLIVQDQRGNRDTVSVLQSGLILTK